MALGSSFVPLLVVLCVRGQAPDLSSSPLTSALQRLAEDALGVKEIQAAYDNAVSPKFKIEDAGEEAIAMLTDRLSADFKKRESALNKLRFKAEEAYRESTRTTLTLHRCCHVKDDAVKFDSRFNTTISTKKSCDRLPSTQQSPITNIAPALQSTFVQNLIDVPQLKWQYFASEEGFATFYPTVIIPAATCGDFDPRYRPWYVAAAAPEPKNVVVILDRSGSMGNSVDGTSTNRLELTKEAVYAVLDTLYPTDDASVIAFSSNPTLPSGCFQHRLAQGTPVNIQKLKDFVKNLIPEDVGTAGERILHNMANQSSTVKRGEFKLISDFKTIRQTLARYYSFFSKPTSSPIVYSMPYYDGLGLGLVITIAAPIRLGLELKGIIAVDVTVDDVLSEASYFVSSGDHQYAFVIDKLGYAVIHPMLAVTLRMNADPIFQNVKLLETDPEFAEVYNSMMRRESGNMTYVATRYVRRGNSEYQGTQAIKVVSTYYWKPVDGTGYVVCLVFRAEELNHLPSLSAQHYQPRKTFTIEYVYILSQNPFQNVA